MALADPSREDTFTPRYREIERAMRQRLAKLSPGAELPSDAELCQEFGVSRMTARHAMNRLVQEGLLSEVEDWRVPPLLHLTVILPFDAWMLSICGAVGVPEAAGATS